ncbi:MAG: T9SS type A sorting domain-containing protein [Salinivirgaceae bacterium]|nr:T9SS type A sorting domain-containing protein [Salinivirgaceae bacterium]
MRRLLLVSILSFLSLTFQAQSFVQIGSGTVSTSYPVYSVWNYGWYSAVYNQAGVGGEKQITSIAFESLNGPKSLANQKIYLKHSGNTVFGDGNYENPTSNGYTLVYDGPVTYNGWTEIEFTTPFAYNGTDHLIVHYESNHGSSTYANFNSTTSAVNNNKGAGSDQAFPTSAGYLNPYPSSVPNIRLFYAAAADEPCTPTINEPNGGDIQVSITPELSFNLSCNTTSYDVKFGASSGEMSVVASDVSVSAEGAYTWTPAEMLVPSTAYNWQVIAKNGELTAESPVLEFTTESVIHSFPYFNGFEDNEVWTPGWYGDLSLTDWHYQTSPINWQLASSLNTHTGQSAAKIDMNQTGSWALVTPRIILGENKIVSFWWKNNATIVDDGKIAGYDSTFFQISQNGGNTWTTLDIFAPQTPTGWTLVYYDLAEYAGNNVCLQWVYQVNSIGGDKAFMFDDLNISVNSNTPEIMLADVSFDFGALCQNGITSHKVVITNQGSGILNITGVNASSPFSSSYSGTIAPGNNDTAIVVFNGTGINAGSVNGSVIFTIQGDFSGNNTMDLSGMVVEPLQSVFETFESTSTNSIPQGWSKFRSNNPAELYNDVLVKEVTSFEYVSATHSLKYTNANDSVSVLAAILPGVTNFDTHVLKFYAAKNSMETAQVGLVIGVTSDPHNSDSIEVIQTILLTDAMTEYTVSIPASNNKPYITIAHNNARVWKSIYLDELSWQNPTTVSIPNPATIVYPLNASTNVDIMSGINLQWTNGGGAPTGYRISVGTDNPPTNIVEDMDLSAVTEYLVAKDLMAFSSTINWQIVPYNAQGNAVDCPIWSFSTMGNPLNTTFPWSESFEMLTSTSEYDVPLGWSIENNGDKFVSWDLIVNSTNAPDNAYDGNQAMHIAFSFLNQVDDWMFTPPMQLEAGYTYKLSFWTKVKLFNGESYEALEVKWGTNNSSEAMYEDALFYNDNLTSETWTLVEQAVIPTEDGIYYFGFHGFSQPLQFLLFIDLVAIHRVELVETYSTTFTITNGSTPIVGASLSINNIVFESDSQGKIVCELQNGDYNYTISAANYDDVSGNVIVNGDDVEVNISLIAGIESMIAGTFQLYPNPVLDLLTIEALFLIDEIQIYDIAGKMVYSEFTHESSVAIHVTDLSKGVYLVKILSKDQTLSNLFIKH